MKPLTNILFCILFSLSVSGQEYEQDMNNIKGYPTQAILYIKKGRLHHVSGWKYVYTFFDFGKIRSQANYEKGHLRAKYSYEYDEDKRRLLEKSIDIASRKDTAEIFSNVYSFDSTGKIRDEKLISNRDKVLWIRDSIKYTSFNLPACYRKIYPAFSPGGKSSVENFILTYNESQLLHTFKRVSDDGGFHLINYKYNEHGDVTSINVEQTIVDSSGQKIEAKRTVEYSYQYDKFGNWTKRFAKLDKAEKELELKRRITYKK